MNPRRPLLPLVEPVVLGLCTIAVAIAGQPRPLALVAAAAGAITTVTSLTHRQKGNP